MAISTLSQDRTMHKRELLSSTSFQCVLYYNFFFSIMYGGTLISLYRWKIIVLPDDYAWQFNRDWRQMAITPVFLGLWFIAEPIRIYMGFRGNLRERVPALVTFVMLSLFPQCIVVLYLLGLDSPTTQTEQLWAILQFIFLVVEITLAVRSLRKFIPIKSAHFQIEYFGEKDVVPQRVKPGFLHEDTKHLLGGGEEEDEEDEEELPEAVKDEDDPYLSLNHFRLDFKDLSLGMTSEEAAKLEAQRDTKRREAIQQRRLLRNQSKKLRQEQHAMARQRRRKQIQRLRAIQDRGMEWTDDRKTESKHYIPKEGVKQWLKEGVVDDRNEEEEKED